MNSIQIVKELPSELWIRISTETFQKLLSLINQENQQIQLAATVESSESSGFSRKIVPFFMNQFYIWSTFQKNSELKQTLDKIKQMKKSKQKRFELGDLMNIFHPKKEGQKYRLIRQAWEKFLDSQDIQNRIQNNKRMKQDSKIKYKKAVNFLRNELKKPYPYFRLLSKERLGRLDESQNPQYQQLTESFEEQEDGYSISNIQFPFNVVS